MSGGFSSASPESKQLPPCASCPPNEPFRSQAGGGLLHSHLALELEAFVRQKHSSTASRHTSFGSELRTGSTESLASFSIPGKERSSTFTEMEFPTAPPSMESLQPQFMSLPTNGSSRPVR